MMKETLWKECVEFHGHACPGLAIGFQAALAAKEHLGIGAAEDEELVCVTENDACGVDAVQYLTKCTVGKGNLVYRPAGKQAFSFFRRDNGASVRLVRKSLDLPEDREERMHAMLALDPADMFTIGQPHYPLPTKARLFRTVICESCGEGAAEAFMRLQDGMKVCTDCREAYSRGW